MNVKRRSGDIPVRNALLLVALGVLLLAGLPATAPAQQDRESDGFAVFSGRITFQRYCASCHGSEALGDGNVAQYLKVQPADLTQLGSKYGGEFPSETIYEYIDGRQDVRGHGTREMPVWGDVFQSSLADPQAANEDGEERADRIIHQLVMYLESIQAVQAE
jgi:mono/diheme cytochrome c family protein